MGELELSASQVNAAKVLLNKVLPDVSQVSIEASLKGELSVRSVSVNGVKPQHS
jgi:hypothetical protein